VSDTLDGRLAVIKVRARGLIARYEELSDLFQRKTLPENLRQTVASTVKGYSAIAHSFLNIEFPGPIESNPANEAALSVADGTLTQLEAGVEQLRKQMEALW
jgi:hypothetical protein